MAENEAPHKFSENFVKTSHKGCASAWHLYPEICVGFSVFFLPRPTLHRCGEIWRNDASLEAVVVSLSGAVGGVFK